MGEHRLSVFENRVLRRIFGPRRDEVMRGWRKLHNEELCDLYSSPSIIRVIKSKMIDGQGMWHRWGRRGTRIGKRPLGRPRRRWVDNIKKDLGEIGCGSTDWIGLAQDNDKWRDLANSVMNLRVP
jgi:hypothetical protein